MPENVVADACVIYGNDQRNVTVTLAVQGAFDLRWTDEIEDEWVRNLLKHGTARRTGLGG